MYIVLWTIKSRVVNLKALYSNMLEYVNRLAMIEQSFPFRGWDEDDEEWICVICFDGEAEGVAGKKRCSLKCSHQCESPIRFLSLSLSRAFSSVKTLMK